MRGSPTTGSGSVMESESTIGARKRAYSFAHAVASSDAPRATTVFNVATAFRTLAATQPFRFSFAFSVHMHLSPTLLGRREISAPPVLWEKPQRRADALSLVTYSLCPASSGSSALPFGTPELPKRQQG